MAMVLAEAGPLDRCQVLGTDCRGAAVARAREGVYDANAVRSAPAAMLEKYFERRGGDWQVSERLRAAVQWRTADVLRIQEPGPWDVILCRNMAMYFHPEASAGLWRQLEQALRPGGVPVLGKAERPHGALGLSMVGPYMYRRDR